MAPLVVQLVTSGAIPSWSQKSGEAGNTVMDLRDKLMIDNVIPANCRRRQKNLSPNCIDHKITFDSVLQSWIIKYVDLKSYIQL